MITPDRWQQIKHIFNLALKRPVAERQSFLCEACGGDEAIREEVASLLSAHEEEDNFLAVPAYEMAAEMLVDDSPELMPGQRLGPYTVLSLLGAGGMGEVYLGVHDKLGRQVALKVLALEFARDEQRVRRFEQEARAASALNHPNVCMIHEIGTADDGRNFMAMEFIDGITLRRRMAKKRLTLKESLDVAAQVAWALEAAHAVGVVHRDVKPENIMLRRDGYVKVLDFGIAKLNAPAVPPPKGHEASTVPRLDTVPGTRMGTVKYMSPEQLREQPVDQRTDIWSLGVVLHEMVTGVTPFEAPTTNDTIAVILEKSEPHFDFYGAELPEEFKLLIGKALSKKRHERYQTIKELAADLSKLRRQLAAEPIVKPVERTTLPIVADDQEAGNATLFSKIKFGTLRTAEYFLSEIKQHKTAAIFTGATLVFAVLLFTAIKPPRKPNVTPVALKMRPLTNSGTSVCAAISPDGKSVAHAEEENGKQKLVLTGTVTGADSVLVPAGDFQYRGITFSRDGNYVYFTRSAGKDDPGALYQLALPASLARKIKDGVDSPVSFSSDGRFAFVRLQRASGEYLLMIADADGGQEHAIATRRDGMTFSLDGPAWAPNDNTIVCGAGWWDNGYHMNLIEINLQTQQERIIGAGKWFTILQTAWLEDKSALVISAMESALSPFQLWRVSYPSGEIARVTSDNTEYDGVSLSRDTGSIVSLAKHDSSQIWIAPAGDVQSARAIDATIGWRYGIAWTSSGKVVFSSMAGDHLGISAINPDGSGKTQLTLAGDNYTPTTTPDGRFIVFASNRGGSFNIWRMNAEDGSDLKQLTFSDGNFYPNCSSDSQWVVFDNQSTSKPTIWKVPIEGGSPIQLTDQYSRMPIVSPDNQFIACRHRLADGSMGIAILPFQGGPPVRLLPIPIMDWQHIEWINNGRALSYIRTVNGISNVWSYEIDTGETKQLTDFRGEQIFAYAWSHNQEQLACERGQRSSVVMMLDK
jgi:eukaryotic-like serine/threonine-protein kinase